MLDRLSRRLEAEMESKSSAAVVSPAELRLMLLRYGLNHPYRVVNLGEIAESLGQHDRVQLREGLEGLAQEGLVTRFSGRYCFNRTIPPELRRAVEHGF